VNRLNALRKSAGLSRSNLAEIMGVDFLEIALAERGIGHVPFLFVMNVAEVLECTPQELFPALAAHFAGLDPEAMSDNQLREVLLSDENAKAFSEAGIDPDIARWFVIVKLKSGNERRYPVSSIERDKIMQTLTSGSDMPFILFMSDCRMVAIKISSISELSFRNHASYAYFSSEESATKVVLVSERSPRPETVIADPSGIFGSGFSDFMGAAMANEQRKFFVFAEDAGETLMNIDLVEAIEVPMGLLVPDLYEDDLPQTGSQVSETLEDMSVMGTA